MRKKIGVLLAGIMLLTAALSGCQSGGGSNNIKIYFSMKESSEWYQQWAGMAKAKAESEGAQMDIEYAESSIETQTEQIKKAMAEGYDAIICSVVSANIASELVATAGDIPIVFVNSSPGDDLLVENKTIYVASNELDAGHYQAEYVLEKLADKEEINVVILRGPNGGSTSIGRTKGVKQTFTESGKKINYVFEDTAKFNPDVAKEIYGQFLKTGVTPDCVISNNDNMALGAIEVSEENGTDISSIMFLGIDASADGCQAIIDGKMDFSVFQDVQGQAEAAAEAAVRAAKGQSIQGIEGAAEDGKHIWIPYERVDSSNVAEYSNN